MFISGEQTSVSAVKTHEHKQVLDKQTDGLNPPSAMYPVIGSNHGDKSSKFLMYIYNINKQVIITNWKKMNN